ncbi:hemerythrin domain-containing protein [Candidimonas nitroreducens]|uniref:Hemerythrin n=1 Tax=Candidimonas nitroreducens TaxID=683354 RepID=A0A225M8F4_9BURK|nr:hemerythrin domain-containing protein [Candidimonas nitroreducens]OWT57615.1 hemerythrin [Candidimonas nitroreducens]
MDIARFKLQHVEILDSIARLREHARAGIVEHAADIAGLVVSMSSIIKVHLAVEDRMLYPAVQKQADRALAEMGRAYQEEMQKIAAAYIDFSRRWNTAAQVARDPEQFRAQANTVLKAVYQRMQKENREFYPAIEAM